MLLPRPLLQSSMMVFFASLSVLGFEVALVRLCSIRYSYHYATLIISIAMIGFVLGGLVSFLCRKPVRGRLLPDPLAPRTLLPFLTALVVATPLAAAAPRLIPFDQYRLLWDNGQILYLVMLVCVMALPFFVYGAMMSLLFRARPGLTGRIYAADLCGAAAGVLGALLLANIFPPEQVIVLLSAIPAIALTAGTGRYRMLSFVLCICLLGIFGVIRAGRLSLPISPYASLSQALKEDDSRLKETINTAYSRIDLFENPRMRFAPGLSLRYGKPVSKGLGVAVDGNIAGVILDEKGGVSYDFFTDMPAALPYLLIRSPRVVVSGNKGGLETLMAHRFGARGVVWTEKDLSIGRLLGTRYGKGGLYGGSFRYESIRHYLRGAKDIDLIVLSRTAFLPSGAFGLQEDYETTVEALKIYLASLTMDGLMYVQFFILPPPRYELRMAKNLAQALRETRDGSIDDCLLIFRSWDTMNFLIKKSGFTTGDRATVERFIEDRGFARVWPESEGPAGILGVDYGALFRRAIDPERMAGFEKSYPFDVRITTDDRPFFHYFLKISRIGEVYRLAGRKWAYFVYEGMALPFLGVLLFAISLVVFAATLFFSRIVRGTPPSDVAPSGPVTRPLQQGAGYCFFALIGTGFMFIEAFFIHALILPLGSAVTAFSFALVALMIGCGTGSLASGKLSRKSRATVIALAPVLLLSGALCLPYVRESPFLILIALLCALPLGVFFPSGIRLFYGPGNAAIPLAYAINGAASIIAPPFASVVASAMGLRMLLLSAAGIYLAAVLIFGLAVPKPGESREMTATSAPGRS